MSRRTSIGSLFIHTSWLIALLIVALAGACDNRTFSRATPQPQSTEAPPTVTTAPPTAAPTDIGESETNGQVDITRPSSLALEQEDIIAVEIRRLRFLASLAEPMTREAFLVESPSTASARLKQTADLLVFPLMSAQLTANSDALDIRSGSPVLQSTHNTDHIFWTWQIRAKEPGIHRLTLSIQGQRDNAALPRNLLEHSYFFKVAEEPFLTRVSTWLGANALGVIGVGGGLVLLLALGLLLIRRRHPSTLHPTPSNGFIGPQANNQLDKPVLNVSAPDRDEALNFDIVFEHSAGGYRARVLNSPAGEAAVGFTLPFAAPLRGDELSFTPLNLAAAKELGAQLFDAIFQGDVRGILQSSLDEAQQRQLSLRLRLRLGETPELAMLPWECLYFTRRNAFLALAEHTPIVRYIDLPGMIPPLTVAPPLHILVVISSPNDYEPLAVEREWEKLNLALQPLLQRGQITVTRTDDAQVDILRQTLRTSDYHILHFIGHGAVEPSTQQGVLVFENNTHRGESISGENLGILLNNYRSVRLVLLNTCEGARATRGNPFGGVAQNLVQQGIPAVIAMQTVISDQAATRLAQEFYSALSAGLPVDAAIASARGAMFNATRSTEWAIPVLYLRASNGVLFAPPPV